MMNEYFMDLHLHIGRTKSGQLVKVTAANDLTFFNIIKEAATRKGIDILGIVDCASPEVIADIERLLLNNKLTSLSEGGLRYKQKVTILLGAEVEVKSADGQAHLIAYFPYLEEIKRFSEVMDEYITNINLSSQMCYLSCQELFEIVNDLEGILIPAHVFTPHKSLYGNYTSQMAEILDKKAFNDIYAIELGLSADTSLADSLSELSTKTFLSNSDAHSLPNIGREYNKVKLEKPTFKEVLWALQRKKGRAITANYGLDPRLGKYYRSFCVDCERKLEHKLPALECPVSKTHKVTTGVLDRIKEIGDKKESDSPGFRPPYYHQISLLDIPGVGEKTIDKLFSQLGTEMEILHKVDYDQLEEVVSPQIAQNIERVRSGEVDINCGGGGEYGKIIWEK